MSKTKTFKIKGGSYKADGVAAIKPVNEGKDVEVRYGDGSNPVVIKNASVSGVVAAIKKVKTDRR